jgi:hypothetical protein
MLAIVAAPVHATTKTRPKIPKALRALVWNTHIGEDKGTAKCICGSKMSQLNFESGHVVSVACGGGSTLDNLRPICGMCNKSMGKSNYFEFVNSINPVAPSWSFFPWWSRNPMGNPVVIKQLKQSNEYEGFVLVDRTTLMDVATTGVKSIIKRELLTIAGATLVKGIFTLWAVVKHFI